MSETSVIGKHAWSLLAIRFDSVPPTPLLKITLCRDSGTG